MMLPPPQPEQPAAWFPVSALRQWLAAARRRPALQPDSVFAKAYEEGIHKSKYWEPVFEDSLNLIAKLPAIAAHIYRKTYCGGTYIDADPSLDWGANLAHMMGARASLLAAGGWRLEPRVVWSVACSDALGGRAACGGAFKALGPSQTIL